MPGSGLQDEASCRAPVQHGLVPAIVRRALAAINEQLLPAAPSAAVAYEE